MFLHVREELGMKILDFAIAVEQAEHDLYQRLSSCSDKLGIQAIFKMMVSDERKLLKKLRKMKEDPDNYELEISVSQAEKKIIKRTNAASCDLLERFEVRDDLSSYNYILRTEQLLLNLYINMKQREDDQDARELLDMIIAEKQEEVDRIHMLYDFVNAPNQFMESGEFSNLKDFGNFGREH